MIEFRHERIELGPERRPAIPSPFPGIDPYVESQGYGHDFHARFITYCRDAINDQLPEP
jgi:Protein of unknown function (DUF4058)